MEIKLVLRMKKSYNLLGFSPRSSLLSALGKSKKFLIASLKHKNIGRLLRKIKKMMMLYLVSKN